MSAIDLATNTVVATSAPCAGPWGLAESADGEHIAVACEWSESVFELDPSTLTVLRRVPFASLRRPRALAYLDGTLHVADFVGGRVSSSDGHTTSLVPAVALDRPALTAMTANLTTALVPAFGTLHATHLLENHTGDTAHEKVSDDYGSVVDGNPKINPAVTSLGSNGSVLYARFDGGPRVFNGPSGLARVDDHRLIVTHESTPTVAVIDTRATSADARVTDVFTVGAGAAGVAVDVAHHLAFVDNAFDFSVSRIDLARRVVVTRTRPLTARYSAAALAGRKLFHDASNTHVTPSGVVACSTCHPGGGDDGLVWFIHTDAIPLKRRRTPHLANATTATAPFHWDGQYTTMGALVRATMSDLMAGDGLLVDADGVQAYLDEIVRAPRLPIADVASSARGRAIFEGKAACSSCHGGPFFTDDAMHAVLSPMSLVSDDMVAQTNTPALAGAFLRAPYLHDGRAPSLHDLLTRPDAAGHGATASLSAADVDDLVAYVQSL